MQGLQLLHPERATAATTSTRMAITFFMGFSLLRRPTPYGALGHCLPPR